MSLKLELNLPEQLRDGHLDLTAGESGEVVLEGRFWDQDTKQSPDDLGLLIGWQSTSGAWRSVNFGPIHGLDQEGYFKTKLDF